MSELVNSSKTWWRSMGNNKTACGVDVKGRVDDTARVKVMNGARALTRRHC